MKTAHSPKIVLEAGKVRQHKDAVSTTIPFGRVSNRRTDPERKVSLIHYIINIIGYGVTVVIDWSAVSFFSVCLFGVPVPRPTNAQTVRVEWLSGPRQ